MDLASFGITEEQVKSYLAPIIQNIVKDEVKGIVQEVVKQELSPAIEKIPQDLERYVSAEMASVKQAVRAPDPLQTSQTPVHVSVNQSTPSEAPSVPEAPGPNVKTILDFITALMSNGSSDNTDSVIEKIAKHEAQKNALLEALNVHPGPSPDVIDRAMYEGVRVGMNTGLKAGKSQRPFPRGTPQNSYEEFVESPTKSKRAVKLGNYYKKKK